MSCNCSSNPCSCANANCACPPDYSVAPATLTCQGTTCEDTIETQCIYTSTDMECAQIPANSSLDDVLQAFDTLLCECGSCSGGTGAATPLYYVDSRSIYTGTGAINKPFQTLEEAYQKIIGSGTVNAPDNAGAVVEVLGGNYTTEQNIYIPNTTWNFQEGTYVTFVGAGTYFIDSSVGNNTAIQFIINGGMNFGTTTGGFIKNEGVYSSTNTKSIVVECNTIYSGMSIGLGTPLIYQNQLTSVNFTVPIETHIRLKSTTSYIASAIQTTVSQNGGRLSIDLQGGTLVYGLNYSTGGQSGVSSGNVIYYNNTDSTTYRRTSSFKLINGKVNSFLNTNAIYIAGVFNTITIEDIKVNGGNSTTFLNVGNVTLAADSNNTFIFLLKDVYLEPSAFGSATVIVYSGSQSLDYMQMQNCVLYEPSIISPSIFLGKIATGLNPVVGYNIIKGAFHITELPTSASGLSSGDVWKNSGVLTIV